MRMRHIVICGLPALQYFPTLSHKRHDFQGGKKFFLSIGTTAPSGPGPPHSRGFLDHTQRRATVGRTPLDE